VKSISFAYASPWQQSPKQAFSYTFQGYLLVAAKDTLGLLRPEEAVKPTQ